jgi:hypothetical protein
VNAYVVHLSEGGLERGEVHRPHEIQRDEDVLSLEAQRDLESLGTGIAVVGAVALVFGHVKRASRAVAMMRGARA